MIDFEDFVKNLGPHAKHYTPEQLKQLHVEVRKMAEVLLAIYRAKVSKNSRSPQNRLDGSADDRTLESVLIERVDDESGSSRAP
jgi:hypothetical protein